MSVSRFTISVEKELLQKLDSLIQKLQFPNRSRTVRYLIRQATVAQHRKEDKVMAGAIVIIYNHHKRELQSQATRIQHDFHHLILSVQHVHLDHENCLETLAVKGKTDKLETLANQLISIKGIQYGTLVFTGSL